MYPRLKDKANPLQQAGASSVSRKTFNPSQKDELKRQIADRLSKKYGIDLVEQIHGKVGSFLDNNKNITIENLQQLENEIKQSSTQIKQDDNNHSKTKKAAAQYDQDDAKSQMSKMSGASNFDRVDQYTKAADREGAESSSKYRNQKLTSLQSKKVDNDLGFLNEENQWAAIYKYNRHLFDKEAEILKHREEQRKKKIKEELDMQVNEKQFKKILQHKEDEAFYQNQLYQCETFDRREQEKMQAAKNIRIMEKEGRDQQIKENRKAQRVEVKQEKALDNYMMLKVKEELEDENRFNQFKKEHQYQVMQKILTENEVRKNKILQEEYQDRQENVKLMDAYCRLLDNQEHERAKAINDRDEKIKAYQSHALEMQEQELECINKKYSQKNLVKWKDVLQSMKFEKRIEFKQHYYINTKLKELEKLQEEKKRQQKVDTKTFLFKQMNDKEKKSQEEKVKDLEQATVFSQDNEKYFEWEKNKTEHRKQGYKEYQQTLRDQMKEKTDVKRSIIDEMNQHESMLNKKTLASLDEMRRTAN